MPQPLRPLLQAICMEEVVHAVTEKARDLPPFHALRRQPPRIVGLPDDEPAPLGVVVTGINGQVLPRLFQMLQSEEDKPRKKLLHLLEVSAVGIFGEDHHGHVAPERRLTLAHRLDEPPVRIGADDVHSAIDKGRKDGLEGGKKPRPHPAVPLFAHVENVPQVPPPFGKRPEHFVCAPLDGCARKVELQPERPALRRMVAEHNAAPRELPREVDHGGLFPEYFQDPFHTAEEGVTFFRQIVMFFHNV